MIYNILLIIVIISIGLYGKSFYTKQNVKSHLGGKISLPKIFWLMYTIYSWFFIPAFLLIWITDPFIKITLIGFLILFWVRGILELFMLYKWKNWRPPYGISHDALCLIFLLVMQIGHLGHLNFNFQGDNGLAMTWIHITTLCMVIEIYYAYAFFNLVKGKTMGEDGVWFADPEDPTYKRINRITTTFNWPLYGHIIYMTWMLLTSHL